MKYKITNVCSLREYLFESSKKIIKRRSNRFTLIEEELNELVYRENNEKLFRCLHEREVSNVLILMHNVHDHFSERIILQRTIERYYWSTRHKNVVEFCKTCMNCQMLDSLKSTQELLLVIFLQSLDVMRIDFIDFIISIIKSEARFICISVDYMTRYLFANVMLIVISKNTVIFFERFVISHFDWSRMIYSDNDVHFKETFDEKLLKQKIKHYFVSINHLSSMSLAKRYVRLVLNVFRIIL